MLFGRNPVVNSASLRDRAWTLAAGSRRRTEARYDKFRKSIPPRTSRPLGPFSREGPENGGKPRVRISDGQEIFAGEPPSRCDVFSAVPLTNNVPGPSLYCPAEFTIDTETREALAIIRSSCMLAGMQKNPAR